LFFIQFYGANERNFGARNAKFGMVLDRASFMYNITCKSTVTNMAMMRIFGVMRDKLKVHTESVGSSYAQKRSQIIIIPVDQ
jgi:hypothetical protein